MLQPDDSNVAQEKIDTANEKKEAGDKAFKSGDFKSALRSYHEALMYLEGLNKWGMQALGIPAESSDAPKKPTEADIAIEKIYANMSACHLKLENWKRALETADKALAKNADNHKATLRKGKALGELGYFEKAEKVLTELKTKNPSEAAAVDAELTRLQAVDRERQRVQDQKLKGFLSRDKKTTIAQPAAASPSAA